MANLDALGNQRIHWLLVPVAIVTLVLAQFWIGAHVKAQTVGLRHSLDSNYVLALELTQDLGYGGLIHHFKNFLLRPEQRWYLEAGRESAQKADELVDRLEQNAGKLGFDTTLTGTRAMIRGYREGLERIPLLVLDGLSTQQMDEALKQDDQFALQEIGSLLEQLSTSVTTQIESIEIQGRALNLVSLGGTVGLSALILTMSIQRRHRNTHMKSIAALNAQLEASNTSLTEANDTLKQFAGIVSHDLKTPLRHISLFNTRILEDIDDRQAVEGHVSMIQTSVVRIMELINGLLDFTRTGFKHPDREMIDIEPLIEDVIRELQLTIDEKQALVKVEATGQVMADALLLRRVLQNLLDNSLKYMKDGQLPHVNIVTKQLDSHATGAMQITISDNGIGIPPEHAERVFEPLQRLHHSQSQYPGSGIGLSLARTVVKAHGGDIEIASDYRGGTRICVTFPGLVSQPAA